MNLQQKDRVGSLNILCPIGIVISIDNNLEVTTVDKETLISDVGIGKHLIKFEKCGFFNTEIDIIVRDNEIDTIELNELIPTLEVNQQGEPPKPIVAEFKQMTGSLKIISTPTQCDIDFMNTTHEKHKLEILFNKIPVGNYPIRFISKKLSIEVVDEVTIHNKIEKELLVDFVSHKVTNLWAESRKTILSFLGFPTSAHWQNEKRWDGETYYETFSNSSYITILDNKNEIHIENFELLEILSSSLVVKFDFLQVRDGRHREEWKENGTLSIDSILKGEKITIEYDKNNKGCYMKVVNREKDFIPE